MVEGTQEKDSGKVIYCMGFKKLLDIKSCSPGRCKYHQGIRREPIQRSENGATNIIGYNEWILCAYPKLERIMTVCEVV